MLYVFVLLAGLVSPSLGELSAFFEYMEFRAADAIDHELMVLAPQLATMSERILTSNPVFQEITMRKRIFKGVQSTLFRIDQSDNVVVKYQADCMRELPFHPLLRDAFFLKNLSDISIVPRMHYVSPPTELLSELTEKTLFTMSSEERAKCVANRGTVRFMISERGMGNLYDYRRASPNLSLQKHIDMLIVIIRGLEMIHKRNIVHGDIHAGNIVILNRNGEKSLGFIDFGLSFFAQEMEGMAEQVREPLSYVHCLHSVWEIEGMRSSYRDDVFRALLILPVLIYGNTFIEYCTKLERNIVGMYVYKKHSFLFDFTYLGSAFELPVVDDAKREAVKAELTSVLDSVRGIDNIAQKPDYSQIITKLQMVIEILS